MSYQATVQTQHRNWCPPQRLATRLCRFHDAGGIKFLLAQARWAFTSRVPFSQQLFSRPNPESSGPGRLGYVVCIMNSKEHSVGKLWFISRSGHESFALGQRCLGLRPDAGPVIQPLMLSCDQPVPAGPGIRIRTQARRLVRSMGC